ncbi:MAG: Uma2 family endonuclease [Cyanophyceae cyanobacterium]
MLSKSTDVRDRGKKIHLCRSLPSVKNYVLVRQDHCQIEVFSRTNDGNWSLKGYGGLDDEVGLSGAIALPMAQVYRNIQVGQN